MAAPETSSPAGGGIGPSLSSPYSIMSLCTFLFRASIYSFVSDGGFAFTFTGDVEGDFLSLLWPSILRSSTSETILVFFLQHLHLHQSNRIQLQ